MSAVVKTLVGWAVTVAFGMVAVFVVYSWLGTLAALVWVAGATAAVQWEQARLLRETRR